MLSQLFGSFIIIVIGVNLLPVVANQVAASKTGNVTGASAAMLDLVTLFYAMGIMVAAVAMVIGGLRNAGLV
jgi:hypothetical protein